MPYKDPQKKIESNRRWRRRVIPAGYGKWLYARRKLRFDNAERFREALEEIAAMPLNAGNPDSQPQGIAKRALEDARIAEEKLGDWERPV